MKITAPIITYPLIKYPEKINVSSALNLNFQVCICKQFYDTYDENEVICLIQSHHFIIELNPEEDDQAFDITPYR